MPHLTKGDFKPSQHILGGKFEVRGDDAGGFDELVGSGVHFEMMSDGQIWLALYPDGDKGDRLTMWITAKKGRLEITLSDDD